MGAQRRSTQSNSLHVGRSEADRRAMPPDEYRSEGTPSLSEGPYVRGETFWFLLGRLPKGTRCKSETASRRYRRNGYVHHQKKPLRGAQGLRGRLILGRLRRIVGQYP